MLAVLLGLDLVQSLFGEWRANGHGRSADLMRIDMPETIHIKVNDGAVPTHRFSPNKPGPLLVIVPSIFGVSPDVCEYAHAFAQQGALVYAIDSFWRSSPGPLPIPDGAPEALKRMHALNPQDALDDVLAVIDAGLKDEQCSGQLIVLGICFVGAL